MEEGALFHSCQPDMFTIQNVSHCPSGIYVDCANATLILSPPMEDELRPVEEPPPMEQFAFANDPFSDTSIDLTESFNIDQVIESIKEDAKPRVFWNFHTCNLCPYRTKSDFLMLNHVKRHRVTRNSKLFDCALSAVERYKCRSCDHRATLLVNLIKHMEVSHGNVVEIKAEKDSTQAQDNLVFVDLNWINVSKSYVCESCRFKTYSQLVYIRHFTKCPLSAPVDDSFYNLTSDQKFLRWHMYHKKPVTEWFKCASCSYKVRLQSELKKHERLVHPAKRRRPGPKSQRLHLCEECPFYTNQIMSLRNHILSKHTADEDVRWYNCSVCPFKTKWRSNLYHHTKKVHQAKKFVCAKCPYYSRQYRLLQAHVAMNHPTSAETTWMTSALPPASKGASKRNKRFHCKLCSFRSKVEVGLMNHMYYKHPTEENKEWFQCQQCPYQTMWQENLEKHMQARHKPVMQCKLCSFKTAKTKSLKEHMAAHEQQSWLECELCKYKSTDQLEFKQHIMESHVVTEAVICFKCQLCKYKTIEEEALSDHILKEHIDPQSTNWFVCEMCPNKYRLTSELSQHIFEKHIL